MLELGETDSPTAGRKWAGPGWPWQVRRGQRRRTGSADQCAPASAQRRPCEALENTCLPLEGVGSE
jgi:hypothetical protein